MSKRTYASLCLDIEVYDVALLRDAAIARAADEGICAEDWEDIRTGVGDDLRMMLDPGSVPNAGFQIFNSSCEADQGVPT